MDKSRQYLLMLKAAKEKLIDRSPYDISRAGNIQFNNEQQKFVFYSFGKRIAVHYPDYKLNINLPMWQHLTILQYMDEADGAPLTGDWMTLHEFREGGMVRGSSFEKEIDVLINTHCTNSDAELFIKAIVAYGGILQESNADVSAVFYLMPNFPMYLKLWLADEDFPANGTVLFDKNAEHYLKVEAAGCMAVQLIGDLVAVIDRDK